MMNLLRYNSRHYVWFPRGYKGKWWPQLNPIESVYDRTWRPKFHEPIWLWQLRKRIFCNAGETTCGSVGTAAKARWNWGPDGNRTCSHCGSIHPDDLMTICRKAIVDDRYSIDGTTKSYKVYVRQPGVRNASEGAIKFYGWHASDKAGEAEHQLLKHAMQVSAERFQKRFAHLGLK